jgi:hypothetical protein
MDTLSKKCMDMDKIGPFCDCISQAGIIAPDAQVFCSKAKTDPTVTNEDLVELKMALLDQAEDACCDC